MSRPAVFRRDGSVVSLGDRIGRGGEGEVYAIANDNAHAVKIYSGTGGADRRDKIQAMVAADLSSQTPLAAFPIHTVHKRNGEFAGFIMRKVSGHHPLFELYAPGARKNNFPHATYPFLVQAAANFARTVGAVHAAGCVIGDINHSGILIADNAMVSLIDADSFQLVDGMRRFLCRVGVPDYTPPELQGVKLDKIVRSPNHDNFGVAIVIFQLLFMGRHPFSGSYQHGDMPIEKAIAEHRFAYSTRRNVGMKPPPGAPLLKHFPSPIGDAFETAFGPAANRPSPVQWIGLLEELRRGLHVCHDEPLHHYWRNAPECPWCRMERLQGISLFLPRNFHATGTAAAMPGATFRLETVWKAIEAITAPGPCAAAPVLQPSHPEPSAEAQALRGEVWKQRMIGAAAALFAGFVLLASPGLWLIWIPAGWFGLARMFGGGADLAKLRTRRSDVERRWTKSLADWRKQCGDEPFVKARAELQSAKTAYSNLPAEEAQQVLKYQQNRRDIQLKAYLSNFYIRRAKISGIGPSKTATLASYGIETAADLTSSSRIERVPGFGPATAINLMTWRYMVEGRFVYNANPTAADQAELNRIKAEIAQKEARLRQQLSVGAEMLRKAASSALARRRAVDPVLQRLHAEKAQIDADLAHVGSASLPFDARWAAAALMAIIVVIALASADFSSKPALPPPVATTPSEPLAAHPVEQPPATASAIPPPDEVLPWETYDAETAYAVRETNVRARPSTATPIIGKLDRAEPVQGVMIGGSDGQKRWLKVTDGPYKGYYVSAAANLATSPRPTLQTSYSGPKIIAKATLAYREPNRDGPVLVSLAPGTRLTVVGTTTDGLAEVSLKSGAIAYVELTVLAEPGTPIDRDADLNPPANDSLSQPAGPIVDENGMPIGNSRDRNR